MVFSFSGWDNQKTLDLRRDLSVSLANLGFVAIVFIIKGGYCFDLRNVSGCVGYHRVHLFLSHVEIHQGAGHKSVHYVLPQVEQKLVKMMSMEKVVAWGECGLDYFDKKTRAQAAKLTGPNSSTVEIE